MFPDSEQHHLPGSAEVDLEATTERNGRSVSSRVGQLGKSRRNAGETMSRNPIAGTQGEPVGYGRMAPCDAS